MLNISDVLQRVIAPIKRELRTMAYRAMVNLINEDTNIQLCQTTSFVDDTKDDVERFQDFGFKSYAPPNSEGIVISLAGCAENPLLLSVENRELLKKLPKLEEGETIIYNGKEKYMHIKDKDFIFKLKKVKIENDDYELVTLISDFVELMSEAKWNTAIGPQPIFAPDKQKLLDLKDKIDSFKV